MGIDPLRELLTLHLTGGNGEDSLFLFLNITHQIMPVEAQEGLHRGVTDALVAVNKRVVADERKAQSRRFIRQSRAQVFAVKHHKGLGEGRLSGTLIADAVTAPNGINHHAMQIKKFVKINGAYHASRRYSSAFS